MLTRKSHPRQSDAPSCCLPCSLLSTGIFIGSRILTFTFKVFAFARLALIRLHPLTSVIRDVFRHGRAGPQSADRRRRRSGEQAESCAVGVRWTGNLKSGSSEDGQQGETGRETLARWFQRDNPSTGWSCLEVHTEGSYKHLNDDTLFLFSKWMHVVAQLAESLDGAATASSSVPEPRRPRTILVESHKLSMKREREN